MSIPPATISGGTDAYCLLQRDQCERASNSNKVLNIHSGQQRTPGSEGVSLQEKSIDSSQNADDPQRTLSAIATDDPRISTIATQWRNRHGWLRWAAVISLW